jgi:two-component system, LytTR family, response regulator
MNKPLTCLIIDDEPIAQEILDKHISKVPFLKLIKKCDNAIEALSEIRDLKPDLILLDIMMPEMTGLELAKIIRGYKPQIILTTAYSEYAVEGFELDVADYLLKPISFDRFLKSANKIYEMVNLQRKANDIKLEVSPLLTSPNNYLWVKQDKKLVHVNVDDILLVKGMKDYVQFFLPNKKITTHMTMAKIEEKLPASLFLRVSRSYIIRKSAIKAINGNSLETDLKEEIVIGSTYRELIKHEINNWLK